MEQKTQAQNRLSAAVTAAALTLYLDSVTGFTAPFLIIVEPGTTKQEVMLVSAVSTTAKTFTVVRAHQGTTGVAHAKGSLVYALPTLGGIPLLITSKADDATLTVAEAGVILVTVDNKTMTLPAAALSAGVRYIIKALATHSDGTVVDGNASETIDGAATKTSDAQYSTIDIVCDGTSWHVLSYIGTWT